MSRTKFCILNAGVGSRLGDLTRDVPKGMIPVAGTPILSYQLAALRRCQVEPSDILIVTGHAAGVIDAHVFGTVATVHNPEYAAFNNIYSVHLLRDHLESDLVLMNGDTLFHPRLLASLLESAHDATLVIDDVKALGAEEMKTYFQDGRLVRIGKDLDPVQSAGEYIGLCRFRGEALARYLACIAEMLEDGQTNAWYEGAMNGIVDVAEIAMTSTFGLPWMEIDTPEDLSTAEQMVSQPPWKDAS